MTRMYFPGLIDLLLPFTAVLFIITGFAGQLFDGLASP